MTTFAPGTRVLVTGAASGLGLALVTQLAERGCRVLATDVHADVPAPVQVLADAGPGTVEYRRLDVTSDVDWQTVRDHIVETWGGLDVLFNNAGAGGNPCTIEDFDADGFDFTVNLLLKSVLLGSHLAVPHLKARGGGAIINTSSVSAIHAGAAPMIYSLCKKAVAHISKLGAAELSKYKIRVNAVLPGLIGTHIFGKGFGLDNAEAQKVAELLTEHAGEMQPIGRIGQGTDIAEMVAFLASDAASFVTGGEFVVDGGMTIGPPHSWQSEKPLELIGTMMGYTPEQMEEKFAEAAARAR